MSDSCREIYRLFLFSQICATAFLVAFYGLLMSACHQFRNITVFVFTFIAIICFLRFLISRSCYVVIKKINYHYICIFYISREVVFMCIIYSEWDREIAYICKCWVFSFWRRKYVLPSFVAPAVSVVGLYPESSGPGWTDFYVRQITKYFEVYSLI